MNKNIIIAIIKNINVDSASKYIKYLDYDIPKEQLSLVLPIIQSNINLLYNYDINSLIEKFPKKVNKSTKEQLIDLFNKHIKKED